MIGTTVRAALAAASAALLAAVGVPGSERADPAADALSRVSEELAIRLSAGELDRGRIAIGVAAPGADGIVAPLETAIAGALSSRGFGVLLLRPAQLADGDAAARALGADALLRVRAGLLPGRRALSVTAEIVPTRISFFLQHAPEMRPAGSRILALELAADPGTLLLARSARTTETPPRPHLRLLGRVSGRVLALAAGEVETEGRTALVAVTADAVLLLDSDGRLSDRRAARPALHPVRAPAATAAVGEFGGGRIAYRIAGADAGEVLAVRGGRLEAGAPLDAAPLCSGGAGPLFGAFAPGQGALEDLLTPTIDPSARPRTTGRLFGVAAAPREGPVAYAVLQDDLDLRLLRADLAPAAPPMAGIGVGFALADLDGDGVAEVVASGPTPDDADRVRVVRLPVSVPGTTAGSAANAELLFESPPIAGRILAGAAGDLTGDGLDDAVLAAVLPSGETALYLVTSDARERP